MSEAGERAAGERASSECNERANHAEPQARRRGASDSERPAAERSLRSEAAPSEAKDLNSFAASPCHPRRNYLRLSLNELL